MPSTHLLIERLLYWVPRILCILFAAFISLFALDVFGEGYGFWHSVLTLMVHLIPTYIVVRTYFQKRGVTGNVAKTGLDIMNSQTWNVHEWDKV